MNNSHDEIKKLLRASREMLSNPGSIRESEEIKSKYGILNEQGVQLVGGNNVTKKLNVAKSVEGLIPTLCDGDSEVIQSGCANSICFNSLNNSSY